MPNFRVHSVGSEKLHDFYKASFESISKDPVLQERYSDKLNELKTKLYPPAPTFGSEKQSKQSSETLPPVDDILSNITKDDVKKKKKKTTDISSINLDIEGMKVDEQSNGYVKPESRCVHSSNYYTKKSDSITHAIRVSLYNKAFERDMM